MHVEHEFILPHHCPNWLNVWHKPIWNFPYIIVGLSITLNSVCVPWVVCLKSKICSCYLNKSHSQNRTKPSLDHFFVLSVLLLGKWIPSTQQIVMKTFCDIVCCWSDHNPNGINSSGISIWKLHKLRKSYRWHRSYCGYPSIQHSKCQHLSIWKWNYVQFDVFICMFVCVCVSYQSLCNEE